MSRRRQRKLERVKPQKGKVSSGFPKQEEARQGHSTTKYIEGKGLYEFTYYNNQWYSKKLNPAKQLDYTETQNILTDSITLNPQGEILIGQSSNIAGLKANQIENTPEAGVLRADYSGHLSTLNLGGAVSKPGDIGFRKEEGSQSFEFMQNEDKKLTYDGTSFKSINNINDGNPIFQLGSSDTECFKISADYKSGEKGLMTISFNTLTAGGDANAGKYFFSVDGTRKLEINDSDLTIMGLGSATADTEALIIENDVSAASMDNTRTSIAFYQEAYDGSSPALADSAKITVGTIGNWTTADSGTHDAYMSFSSVLNGTMNTTIKAYGNGQTSFCEAGNEYVKILPHSTDSELDITGNFVLDASGDIELNADGSTITFKDGSATNYTFEGGLNPVMTMNSLTFGDSLSITLASSGVATLATVDSSSDEGHLVLDADGDIHLDAVLSGASDNIAFKNAGTTFGAFQIHHSASWLYLYENGGASTDDHLSFKVEASGVSTIATTDGGGTAADLLLDADGDITLDSSTGKIYVKNDGGNYTPGSDYEIATKKYVDDNAGGTIKYWMDWYYYSANLATQNYFYATLHNDEFGVSSSINTDLSSSGYSTTSLNNMWRWQRYSRRIPYSGSVTKLMVHLESTGAAADSDVEVALWYVSPLTLDTAYASTANASCDHLGTITFDFSSASRNMTKELTSFNATSITQGGWFFITLRKITSGDGSSFHCHPTVLWDGS